MSVHWSAKNNPFVHCAACAKADKCKSKSERLTAGCANGKKLQ